MKRISMFIFIVVSMLMAPKIKAQIKFGPKAGLNLSGMSIESNGVSFNPTTMAGFHIGVVVELRLKNNFYLQPGIFYSTKGSKYEISLMDVSISPDYIEIPVNTVWKIKLKGAAKLLLYTGPYFAFGIGGSYEINGETQNINFGSSDNDDLKPFDFGMNVGGGIEINNFEITAQYGFGFFNLDPDTSSDITMKMNVLSFSLAYLFGK